MFGTIFNTVMIILVSIIGSFFKQWIIDDYHTILLHAMGLVAMCLGINAIVQHLPSSMSP
ncbi:DUF554 family protein, partial [Niallia circulans]|uniref:DUF554 family protein n=1 Tax=Niallia circulans TaxID=1397 RepID=UPI0015618AC5